MKVTTIQANDKQRECIETLDGPIMVLAGPGTGKTFSIIERIKFMLEKNVLPEEILCLTFSEAAAAEMKSRLISSIGSIAGLIDINTYHGFCSGVIKPNPDKFEILDNIELVDDITKHSLITQCLDEYNPKAYRTERGDCYYYIPEILHNIDEMKLARVNKNDYFSFLEKDANWGGKLQELNEEKKEREKNNKPLKTFLNKYETHLKKMNKAREMWDIYELYSYKMFKNNLYDFNDMINFVLDALENNPDFLKEIASKYRYFLIDEYQDTNNLQNKLIFLLQEGSGHDNILVVGDDEQIIFGFQGAASDNLANFLNRYKNAKVICFSENNRSTQTILDISRKIINQDEVRLENDSRFFVHNISKKLIAKNKSITSQDKKVEFNTYAQLLQENNNVVQKIEDFIKDGADLSQIAIIARKHSELEEFAKLLEQKNIPYQLKTSKSIFEIHSGIIIYLYLKMLDNYFINSDKIFGLLTSAPFNIAPDDYLHLLKKSKINHKNFIDNIKEETDYEWKNKEALDNFVNVFFEILKLKNSTKPSFIIQKIVNETGLLKYYLNEDVEKTENIAAVKRFIQEAHTFERLNKVLLFGDFIKHLDKALDFNIPLNIEKNIYIQKAIQLTTFHSSKGREFEIVFIPHLISDNWEKDSKSNKPKIPISKTYFSDDEKVAKNSELLKLLFVGITRAKHTLILSSHSQNQNKALTTTQYLTPVLNDLNLITQREYELSATDDINEFALSITLNSQKSFTKEMEKEILSIANSFIMSPKSLNKYLNCPKSFLLSEIYEIPVFSEDVDSANFGISIHSTIEMMNIYAQKNKKYPSKDKVIEYFKNTLDKKELTTELKAKELLERGEKCLEKYYTFALNTPPESIYEVEYKIAAEIDEKYKLKGFIDKIEKSEDGTFTIFDYKTSSAKSMKSILDGGEYESYLNQLRFYKYALEKSDKNIKINKSAIVFVETPEKSLSIEMSDEDNRIIEQKIMDTYGRINSLEFSAVSDEPLKCKNCKFCNYKMICKS